MAEQFVGNDLGYSVLHDPEVRELVKEAQALLEKKGNKWNLLADALAETKKLSKSNLHADYDNDKTASKWNSVGLYTAHKANTKQTTNELRMHGRVLRGLHSLFGKDYRAARDALGGTVPRVAEQAPFFPNIPRLLPGNPLEVVVDNVSGIPFVEEFDYEDFVISEPAASSKNVCGTKYNYNKIDDIFLADEKSPYKLMRRNDVSGMEIVQKDGKEFKFHPDELNEYQTAWEAMLLRSLVWEKLDQAKSLGKKQLSRDESAEKAINKSRVNPYDAKVKSKRYQGLSDKRLVWEKESAKAPEKKSKEDGLLKKIYENSSKWASNKWDASGDYISAQIDLLNETKFSKGLFELGQKYLSPVSDMAREGTSSAGKHLSKWYSDKVAPHLRRIRDVVHADITDLLGDPNAKSEEQKQRWNDRYQQVKDVYSSARDALGVPLKFRYLDYVDYRQKRWEDKKKPKLENLAEKKIALASDVSVEFSEEVKNLYVNSLKGIIGAMRGLTYKAPKPESLLTMYARGSDTEKKQPRYDQLRRIIVRAGTDLENAITDPFMGPSVRMSKVQDVLAKYEISFPELTTNKNADIIVMEMRYLRKNNEKFYKAALASDPKVNLQNSHAPVSGPE